MRRTCVFLDAKPQPPASKFPLKLASVGRALCSEPPRSSAHWLGGHHSPVSPSLSDSHSCLLLPPSSSRSSLRVWFALALALCSPSLSSLSSRSICLPLSFRFASLLSLSGPVCGSVTEPSPAQHTGSVNWKAPPPASYRQSYFLPRPHYSEFLEGATLQPSPRCGPSGVEQAALWSH